MPSSYTSNLRLTLPVQGELSGTWGDTVNTGITALTDTAIAGTAAVTMTDANYTLTTANGASDQARAMFVTITGTITAARNIIVPSSSKLYYVTNNTTGGFALTVKTSAGTGISVANGKRMALYCDATNVLNAFDAAGTIAANINGSVGATTPSTGAFTTLSASGAFSLTGDQVQVSEGGTGASTAATALVNLGERTGATGSVKIATGTTAQRDGTPAAGYFRFNSTNTQFEGYNGSAWTGVGGASGGGGNPFVYENDIVVTVDYTITTGKNAGSFGPIVINSGVTVTVPSGSVWSIV